MGVLRHFFQNARYVERCPTVHYHRFSYRICFSKILSCHLFRNDNRIGTCEYFFLIPPTQWKSKYIKEFTINNQDIFIDVLVIMLEREVSLGRPANTFNFRQFTFPGWIQDVRRNDPPIRTASHHPVARLLHHDPVNVTLVLMKLIKAELKIHIEYDKQQA